MRKRWRIWGWAALVLLIGAVVAFFVVDRGLPTATFAVTPPASVAAAAADRLGTVGPVEGLRWAAPQTGWRAPGRYRVFYASPSSDGPTDIYRAEVRIDSEGGISNLAEPVAFTETPAGDESVPILCDDWLAFATSVAGRYQSVTCVPLDRLSQPDLYVLTLPTEALELSWLPDEGAGARLRVRTDEDLVIDPSVRRVEQGAEALVYQPAVKGEQAWLPNLVSRVRELPFVGPEKIAFLENVVFSVRDWFDRLFHGSPAATPEPEAEASPSSTSIVSTASTPSATPPTLPSTGPTTAPTISAPTAVAPTATATSLPETPLTYGVARLGTVRPDPKRSFASAEVVSIDPSLLQLRMIPGTIEPRPSTGLVGSGVIPQADWPLLVAGFNGGFAAMHGSYGMMVDYKIYLPPRDGLATVAVYEDGSIRMGTWGKDFVQTPDMVSFRQNCPPLVENGTITAETGKLTLWGLSVSNEVYLYRSGLGINKDGKLLYVAGKPLSAYTLAVALKQAGAVYGMQLDVDEYHVAFLTYDVQQGQGGAAPVVTATKLKDDMHGFDGWFLRPFQLDFFYLTRRAQPLAQAVRTPAPTPTAAVPTPVAQAIPGTIAFSSNRSGRWQIYTLTPGQSGEPQPLLSSAVDDLYPAWSPDGTRLAFASRRTGDLEIFVLDRTSGALAQITHQPSEEWAPSWSPDGTRLLYQSDRNGQSDIYVCAASGGEETRLTPMEGNHEAPQWSPDGKTIAFDSDLDVKELVSNSINLYYMDADGSNPRRIYPYAESPAWSPDGKSIAFLLRQIYWQVFVMSTEGGGLRQLTTGAYDSRCPAWSPDGRWIVFSGKESGHWELYAVSVEGGAPVRLTYGTADCSYPTWRE